jgi:hypothetical protein
MSAKNVSIQAIQTFFVLDLNSSDPGTIFPLIISFRYTPLFGINNDAKSKIKASQIVITDKDINANY